jgi:hypothetical protein
MDRTVFSPSLDVPGKPGSKQLALIPLYPEGSTTSRAGPPFGHAQGADALAASTGRLGGQGAPRHQEGSTAATPHASNGSLCGARIAHDGPWPQSSSEAFRRGPSLARSLARRSEAMSREKREEGNDSLQHERDRMRRGTPYVPAEGSDEAPPSCAAFPQQARHGKRVYGFLKRRRGDWLVLQLSQQPAKPSWHESLHHGRQGECVRLDEVCPAAGLENAHHVS